MKGFFLVAVSIIFALMLCSCSSTNNKIKPLKTEVIDFNIQKAKQMIGKGDKIIADIAIKDTISRQEYNQFLADITEAYDGYKDAKWEYMLFYNTELEDEKIETLRLNKHMFYPTMYHEGVEVVSARTTNTHYQDESLNTSLLTIKEEYSGKDKNLKGWFREYLYRKNNEDKWIFYTFGGQVNFAGEDFTSDYLALKK